MKGYVHSIETFGSVDGPGIRYVVFMQGCPMRCLYCHNPDTWDRKGGQEVSAEEIFRKATRYRAYFGKDGGITVSGGEPLLQAAFVKELFTLCKKAGLHTALDTSGCIWNEEVGTFRGAEVIYHEVEALEMPASDLMSVAVVKSFAF